MFTNTTTSDSLSFESLWQLKQQLLLCLGAVGGERRERQIQLQSPHHYYPHSCTCTGTSHANVRDCTCTHMIWRGGGQVVLLFHGCKGHQLFGACQAMVAKYILKLVPSVTWILVILLLGIIRNEYTSCPYTCTREALPMHGLNKYTWWVSH